MGQSSSSYEEEEEDPGLPSFLDESKAGYRVLALQVGSPASNEGIVPFFDFIVEANEQPLVAEDGSFVRIIQSFENKPLTVGIYNCKCKSFRRRSFVPRRGWGGDGLLGLTIKFDSYEDAEEKVLHVLDVKDNSPAALAGIEPFTDYLLGTPHLAFNDLDDLYELVADVAAENDRGRKTGIDIFVYSTRTDTVRRLFIEPRSGWGGEGLLGCGIGHGYLHRLPKSVQSTVGLARKEDLIPTKASQGLPPLHHSLSAESSVNDEERQRLNPPEQLANSQVQEIVEQRNGSHNSVVEETQGSNGVMQSNMDTGDQEQPDEDDFCSEVKKVETMLLGRGTLCGTKANGVSVVDLDWNLPNGAKAIAFLSRKSYTVLPSKQNGLAKQQPQRRENEQQQDDEDEEEEEGVRVIQVDLKHEE